LDTNTSEQPTGEAQKLTMALYAQGIVRQLLTLSEEIEGRELEKAIKILEELGDSYGGYIELIEMARDKRIREKERTSIKEWDPLFGAYFPRYSEFDDSVAQYLKDIIKKLEGRKKEDKLANVYTDYLQRIVDIEEDKLANVYTDYLHRIADILVRLNRGSASTVEKAARDALKTNNPFIVGELHKAEERLETRGTIVTSYTGAGYQRYPNVSFTRINEYHYGEAKHALALSIATLERIKADLPDEYDNHQIFIENMRKMRGSLREPLEGNNEEIDKNL
jgi:hypothetical protein